MYPSVRSVPPVAGEQHKGRASRVLSQNLVALGFTSFFTDISSEMVIAVVPIFLTTTLGFGFFGVALYEAAFEAVTAFARIFGGSVADKRQSHKKVAAAGYSFSALTRLGLVASTFVVSLSAVPFLLLDRLGKGVRTAPRDALISLSTAPNRLAQAFGIHRAMDTAGAILGPLVAFLVLTVAPDSIDGVFAISAAFAGVGAAVIWLFAQEKPQPRPKNRAEPALLDQWREVRRTPGMARLAGSVALLSVLTVGDAFILLIVQTNNIITGYSEGGTTDIRYFPLLFAGVAVSYLVLAIPFGRLADRLGTRPVYLAGHGFLIALYLVLGFVSLDLVGTIIALALLGAYYAATDGVVPAMVSRRVAPQIRGSGIAFITVVITVGRMVSALLFATLFETIGTERTMIVLALAMVGAIVVGLQLIPHRTEPAVDQMTKETQSNV